MGLYPRSKSGKDSSRRIDLVFALAKRAIAMHWRSALAPPVDVWKRELRRWAHLEDMVIRRLRF